MRHRYIVKNAVTGEYAVKRYGKSCMKKVSLEDAHLYRLKNHASSAITSMRHIRNNLIVVKVGTTVQEIGPV